MGVERFLDLAGIDVVPAANDQLLLPVDEEEVSVLVEIAEVAGREPAVRVDRLGCRCGVVPVPGDHRRSAEPHLADSVLACVDAQLRRAEWLADRPWSPGLADEKRRRDAGELGQAVTLADVRAEHPLEVALDGRRNGGAADVRDSQWRQPFGSRAPPRRARCTSSAPRATPSFAVAAMSDSVCSGSKRGTIATAAPARNVDTSPVERPRTWENGAAPRTTSSAQSPSAVAAFSAATRMPAWVRIAPFGLPEVPDVNRSTAGVVGLPRADRAPPARPSALR